MRKQIEFQKISPTTTSTRIPEDHDSGGGRPSLTAGPALPKIGAPGLLAHGVELELPQLRLDGRVLGPSWDSLLHPFRLRERLLLRPDLHRVDEVREGGGLRG